MVRASGVEGGGDEVVGGPLSLNVHHVDDGGKLCELWGEVVRLHGPWSPQIQAVKL